MDRMLTRAFEGDLDGLFSSIRHGESSGLDACPDAAAKRRRQPWPMTASKGWSGTVLVMRPYISISA